MGRRKRKMYQELRTRYRESINDGINNQPTSRPWNSTTASAKNTMICEML